ncbi:TPA: hypothetical protein H1016_04675 [archaeon]|uniref:Uncharacterized protein n=1 Tax=Candidatus Naiadarchaeum limnaeum TaxID=2756139 RepID=A0A832XGZ9_9ARCH|nr:hypothetical protein [Candidatus Naiadarchaeum limnaeum]
MKIKTILANRKAQEEIAMGLAALALILILGILSFYYFIVLRGKVVKEGPLPFIEREHLITTTNYLNNFLLTRDEFGISYSTLIERSIDNPNGKHPSGKTMSTYFSVDVLPKICEWLEQNLGKDVHRLKVMEGTAEKYRCGVNPTTENLFTENQLLPLKSGGSVDISLETWVL